VRLEIRVGEVCVRWALGLRQDGGAQDFNRLIEPTSGEIMIERRDARALAPDRLRRRIGYVIQQAGLLRR